MGILLGNQDGPRRNKLQPLQAPTIEQTSVREQIPLVPNPNATQGNSSLLDAFNYGIANNPLAKYLGTPLNMGGSNTLANQAKGNFQKGFAPSTTGEKIASTVGKELVNLPLWAIGEGAFASLGSKIAPKVLPKLAPKLAPVTNKIPVKLQPILKGGLQDAASYGAVVAPAETLLEGGNLQTLAEKEKALPFVFGGGAALRGIGSAISGKLAKNKLELPLPKSETNPKLDSLPRLTDKNLAKMEFGLDSPLKPLKKELTELPSPLPKAKTVDEQINELVANSNKWNDKNMPSLQRETWDRNIIDIAGKEDGQKIKEVIFNPIHKKEADRTRWKNENRGKVKELNLSKTESEIVQRVGERKLDINDIPKGMSKEKISKAVNTLRNFYDEAIEKANQVLVENGYKPVPKLPDYFPHFTGEDPLLKALGIRLDLVDLPTDINGLTHQFKPGKNWFGNFQKRTGDQTTFDAVEGFDRYIEGVSRVIFHTDNIQKLRKFNRAIRTKYSPQEIQDQVGKLIANKELSRESKEAAIDELLGRDSTHLSNTVADLEEFTNVLAGKKDLADRADERRFGRQVYNVATFLENRIGKNMVAVNPASWITNFIPITQSLATTDKASVARALAETMKNIVSKDGFIDKSTFLTNRVGSDVLSKGITDKVGDALTAPMKWVDVFTSQVITRAKYHEGIKKGLSPQAAMSKADEWAAKIIGDRSLGSQPTLFNQRSPLTRLFTQFQLEVNNQLSFLLKDIPREYLADGVNAQNVAKLSSAIGQLVLYSYLFNNIYESAIGRRPALDPIGIAFGFKKDIDNPNLDTRTAASNLAERTAQQLPFFGGIIGGGRIPISAAVDPLRKLPGNVIDAATNPEGSQSGLSEAGKNLLTAGAYIVPPFGGGQLKKTIEGGIALNKGGSFSGDQLRFPIEKTPGNIAKSLVFGQYATDQGKKYIENNRRPLSENQTKQVTQSLNPLGNYEKLMKERRMTTLKNKIRDIRNDKNIDAATKDKRIKPLADELDKIMKE